MIWNARFPNWFQKEFMANIVGSEATQQRGVLHRQSDVKFDQDLAEFKALWDTRQSEACNTSKGSKGGA